ncbi:2-phospho-L-lactate transferase [Bradyrhizobium ottawaense]|uniref:2-phospho-L-lactate transferase n=1 Tax=Bradyrhizobium ottawaense TaxID=931866 RepID=UPI003837C967
MILAIAGGVGGARLMRGLAAVLPASELIACVNTGDDFIHYGLHISPDLDTVMYTLAGINDEERGWGRGSESWKCMEAMRQLAAPTWFSLGDSDLAIHLERTRRLAAGESLSSVTDAFARALQIGPTITPMSDDAVRTVVITNCGEMGMQEWFVRERCCPRVFGLHYAGGDVARAAPAVAAALKSPELRGIVLCPSNPFLSIRPVLAVPEIAKAVAVKRVPVVAVSPIIAGQAVKGPAAQLLRDLGFPVSSLGVAEVLRQFVDGWLIDERDAAIRSDIEKLGATVATAPTLMRGLAESTTVARHILALVSHLSGMKI